jgi:iron-sulfur cluster assembly protein
MLFPFLNFSFYVCVLFYLISSIKMTDSVANSHPITLTDGAITQLKRIMEEQNIPSNYGLRVGVKGGGCSGFSYVLGFDEQKEKDDVYEISGFKVLMEKAHAIYLLGMEVDWVDGLNNRGFMFNNPNAKSTCGCGSSFSA